MISFRFSLNSFELRTNWSWKSRWTLAFLSLRSSGELTRHGVHDFSVDDGLDGGAEDGQALLLDQGAFHLRKQ